MPAIRVLEDHLVNKIAAGEVVARPASAVKELVENAIDAGARRIEVEMEEGGLGLIRVTDDGCGMTEQEALLALQRHATSKIASEPDLDDIRTFGFRGEALPSIACVSRMEIRTRPADAQAGTRIALTGGKVDEVRPAASPVGSAFTVRELFFNTPARRKFLRSESTETRHIIDTVADAILGNPDISFKLSVPGKQTLFSSPGSGKLFDAIVAVLGAATARGMIELVPRQHPELPYSARGFISRPDVHRATRTGFHLFINGRPVQLPQMARAVADSYRSYLPQGRWPIAVLFVDAAPWAVDVNVHPQKLEVRLHQPERLAGLLGAAVRDALSGERRPEAVVAASLQRPSGDRPDWSRMRNPMPYMPLPSGVAPAPEPATAPLFEEQPASPLFARAVPGRGADWERLHVIGQIFKTFVVGVSEGRLYFIDQHTAHERVLYEQHLQKMLERRPEVQPLLLPVTMELPRRSQKELEDASALLSGCGFESELFSGNTLVVKSVPVLDRPLDVRAVVEEVLEETTAAAPIEMRRERVARTVSCKAAVKSGDTLSEPEMRALVRDLGKTENPLRCPHGRPILLQFTEEELKKLFERNW